NLIQQWLASPLETIIMMRTARTDGRYALPLGQVASALRSLLHGSLPTVVPVLPRAKTRVVGGADGLFGSRLCEERIGHTFGMLRVRPEVLVPPRYSSEPDEPGSLLGKVYPNCVLCGLAGYTFSV